MLVKEIVILYSELRQEVRQMKQKDYPILDGQLICTGCVAAAVPLDVSVLQPSAVH